MRKRGVEWRLCVLLYTNSGSHKVPAVPVVLCATAAHS